MRSSHYLYYSSLTAIIGNKGSGKSALSDIIALTAESDKVDEDNASFLNPTMRSSHYLYYR
jgi:predicted ATPase